MNSYTAYQYTRSGKIEDVVLIKEGFNFSAFLFGPVWLLYNKLWGVLGIYIIFYLGVIQLLEKNLIDFTQSFLLSITLHFYLGYIANDHLQKRLKLLRYELIQIIIGKNEDEALLRLVDKYDFTLPA